LKEVSSTVLGCALVSVSATGGWGTASAWFSVPVAVAVVAGYFTVRLSLLRRRRVTAGPATPDLGDEPPAVVCLLVNGLADAPQVASATLLDLAARRVVDLHEVAPGAEHTLVRVGREPLPESAPAYERRVLERVAATAGGTYAPVAELVRTYADGGSNWQRRLVRDALLDARLRGLVSSAESGCALGVLAAALALGALLAPLVPRPASDGFAAAVLVLGLVWVVGSLLGGGLMAAVSVGEKQSSPDRYTARGREVTARWLGVAAWLRNHPAMRDLPPGAVAVWDRYLAYGAALDAIPHAVRVLDFETTGQRAELTSRHTGTERTVHVEYWSRNRFLRPGGPAAAQASRVWSVLTLPLWIAVGLAAVTTITSRYAQVLVVLLAGVQTARAAYRLVRAQRDLSHPVEVTGTVLDVTTAHRQHTSDGAGPQGEGLPDLPTHFYVVVDDGSSDVVRPWIVNRDLARGERDVGAAPFGSPEQLGGWLADSVRPFFAVGDRVTVVGQPRSRFATSIAPADDAP
jgi:hypothetical protein